MKLKKITPPPPSTGSEKEEFLRASKATFKRLAKLVLGKKISLEKAQDELRREKK